ncbi:Polyadenylate-binding protein-interacting protein 11 [Vitis vinifera]|uniref:Polyadenylate-binding protein-interacting protein 11 n=1 Tax=Vitis vinifera TaxID=29760 RepID=A0A438I7K1_VITVI|nr:Polyadenylate-binding protein-interacting protein 11 [Vitis vinifera]RVW92672.1 Polyadenylate-binding protein-interacting protein 11 [Vitis vinifera]
MQVGNYSLLFLKQIIFLHVQAESAIVALNCSGLVLGTQPIRVSPSKTPVRPRVPRATLH